MEAVRKTFFDPLATSKPQIRAILETLPIGSAHPFSPEKILLCRTESGIQEIDISSYPEDYFFNAVDLGEMGEVLLRRMSGFQSHLSVFDDFQIMQAPAATFKIPIVADQITILAVSERTPTYYDFCFADAEQNACCWLARETFPGITHSGDLLNGKDLLDYVMMNASELTKEEICVFISGYQTTQITRFLGTSPALLVADHVDKILYIVPVPLEAATIGDATICCPLVIKGDGNSLICSILPTATTDRDMFCASSKMKTPCFAEAIKRADFKIAAPSEVPKDVSVTDDSVIENFEPSPEHSKIVSTKKSAVIGTRSVVLPPFVNPEKAQEIRFDTSLDFVFDKASSTDIEYSNTVLPAIFGSRMEGPLLLATGGVSHNVPFPTEKALRSYYESLESILVVVDERMTDNARNLATQYRLNALFIVQLSPEKHPRTADQILSVLNSCNINAVTALAGPQSLVLVQIQDSYYFYRGIANLAYLNTSKLAFGSDITSTINSVGMDSLVEPRAKRVVSLDDGNFIILPNSGKLVEPKNVPTLFNDLPLETIKDMEEDVSAAVSQLQLLLGPKEMTELSGTLVPMLSAKINDVVAPTRKAYMGFLTQEFKMGDPVLERRRQTMLGEWRKTTKELQKDLEPIISSFANMMSSQNSSKRTHDLKRLARQAKIQGNVEAAKAMNFESMAGLLEEFASEMGVLLVNIGTSSYSELMRKLKNTTSAIDASSYCDLDSRILHLEGFDAGIIIEQSQNHHRGPLASQSGPTHPILAMPNPNGRHESESMLAWVCWDEFVNLTTPFSTRWMEKCNEAHISALRIITRDTLSNATASREHQFHPSSTEIGNLMSTLLMASMSKLAAMKTTMPVVSEKASDTVTRLMRGLFGNLLTVAGSGVRPMSMVWQLFGLNPQFDVPTKESEWFWYEQVVSMYPYTGWPIGRFNDNLEKLLDKVILRVVTKSENPVVFKESRVAQMIKYCKLRNIQLDHSRTIITICMRMLTGEYSDTDRKAIAGRLLEQVPHKLEKQSKSYGRMIAYLEHLAQGGERRPNDDLIAASVYNKRSAAFSALKTKIAEACTIGEWQGVKANCQLLVDENTKIASLWNVKPEVLQVQNMKAYKALLQANFDDDASPATKAKNLEFTRQVHNDAEQRRVPWQIGKDGRYGDDIDPLDENFVHEILTGETPGALEKAAPVVEGSSEPQEVVEKNINNEFSEFSSTIQPAFIAEMQKDLSAEDVCGILKVPASTMRIFIASLNPDFDWSHLPGNFKSVVLGLLRERSNREISGPTKKLLELKPGKNVAMIEG